MTKYEFMKMIVETIEFSKIQRYKYVNLTGHVDLSLYETFYEDSQEVISFIMDCDFDVSFKITTSGKYDVGIEF